LQTPSTPAAPSPTPTPTPPPAPTPPPTPAPPLTLSITSPELQKTLAAGDEIEFTVTGSWSGGTVSDPFIQLVSGNSHFIDTARFTSGNGRSFTLAFDSLPDLSPGAHSGTLTLRACEDAACARPIGNATAAVAYRITVSRVEPWGTFQGNVAHNGSVPVILNPARFRTIWSWTRPVVDEPLGGINPVASADGKVFVSTDVYFGTAILHALDEKTGTEAWRYSFGNMPSLNPPAVAGGKVYLATMGHSDTWLYQFDAATGAFGYKAPFESQWGHIFAPTVFAEHVLVNGGYYGGQIYAFKLADGSLAWKTASAGDDDMTTPTAVGSQVLYYSGSTLEIFDRASGASTATVVDPTTNLAGYSYHAAPMLGGRNNVVAFSGGSFSGRASANVEHFDERQLVSFNLGTRSFEWASPNKYLTQPAVADGVIYAGGSNPLTLDALDEVSGKVLWRWRGTGADNSFHRNLIVTKSHLFVSTDRAVYAIDLKTHQAVWSYPMPGMLALSASTPTRVLYVATGARESDGKLVAIRLN
jgi:outer membrane protein assembly factor BamB